MKNTILILILSLSSCSIFAQDEYLQDTIEVNALSEKVIDLFSQNKISKCFKEMSAFWPIPENEVDLIKEKTVLYLNLIESRFGEQIGIVKLRTEKIEDFARKETYLVRYENSAIKIMFIYYKNEKGWIVNSFKWKDTFEEEFR